MEEESVNRFVCTFVQDEKTALEVKKLKSSHLLDDPNEHEPGESIGKRLVVAYLSRIHQPTRK